MLLGVRAVIAESYERIHRSNLVGMGVLPLQFPAGQTLDSLGLTGEETYELVGLAKMLTTNFEGGRDIVVRVTPKAGPAARILGAGAHRYPTRGSLLPTRWDFAVRAPTAVERGKQVACELGASGGPARAP